LKRAAALFLVACSTSSVGGGLDASADAAPEASVAVDAGRVDAGSMPPTGLPCDVQSMLREACQGCHSPDDRAGLVSLITHADLVDTAPRGGRVLDRSLARMTAASDRMPPNRAATPAEIATLAGWADAGAPAFDGGCPR